MIREAVEAERGRLRPFERSVATTEQGKDLQREMGGSRAYIDAVVEQAAAKRLRRYTPAKNVKPLNQQIGARPRRNLNCN